MGKTGFDNERYLLMQSEKIKERISTFGGKLYLEFGGKLFDDFHASRVLPGFKPDSKINMLVQLKDEAEIVIVINASHIEKNKVRSDLGITYDADVLGSKRAGWNVIWYNHRNRKSSTEVNQADKTVHSPEELLETIKEIVSLHK